MLLLLCPPSPPHRAGLQPPAQPPVRQELCAEPKGSDGDLFWCFPALLFVCLFVLHTCLFLSVSN